MSASPSASAPRMERDRRSPAGRWLLRVALALGAVLGAASVAPRIFLSGVRAEAFASTAKGLFQLWLVVALAVALVVLWRRLTYRVGVRLFISYLLIGLVPFALFASFLFLAGYMLIGQYTSVRFGQEEARLKRELTEQARVGLREVKSGRAGSFAPTIADGPEGSALEVRWVASDGRRRWHSSDAALLPLPSWVQREGEWSGVVVEGSTPFLAGVCGGQDGLVAVLLPLNLATSRELSRGRWFELRFTPGELEIGDPGESSRPSGLITVEMRPGGQERGSITVDGVVPGPEYVEPGWFLSDRTEARWIARRFVVWFRLSAPARLWTDGGEAPGRGVITLVRTSPAEAWADFLASPYEAAESVTRALIGVAVFFGIVYLAAVGMAGLLIVRIARSTARLSRGAREVAAGNLDWRIPVRRRDQLGELAQSFNRMAASIASMLDQVAEKERLLREVELAREIQENLLPRPELTHGDLEVVALFRPAAEVGGDLFDLFPEDSGRLRIVVGDVAGHGLSTGLLMAMVKAGVATLVQSGLRGPDLAEGLNRMLMQQPVRRRMVTLVLAECDPEGGTLTVTSAGHPPPFLISPRGAVDELLLPALPLGLSWTGRSPQHSVPFPPGSAVVLFSDGLVEACNPSGEEFGFQRLQESLVRLGDRMPAELLAALLEELDDFREATPLPDDLTVVVVRRRAGVSVPGR